MEEKKKQENDDTVHEADTKPCQQDEKACSEEKAETTENDKPMEETTDLDDDENKIDLREVIGKEVTWAAVAALGGAAIAIWNIIRYVFLLFSSYMMHSKTKVPIYLLMMRRNVGFTDGYVFFATIIALCTLTNPFRFLNSKVRGALGAFSSVLEYVLIIFLFLYLIFYDNHVFRIAILFKLKSVICYIFPLYIPLSIDYIEFQKERILIQKAEKHESVIVESNTESSEKHKIKTFGSIEKMFWFRKIVDFLFDEPVYSDKKNTPRERICLMTILVTLIFLGCMSFSSAQTEGLLDQDGRYVVADLGEQYIVQSAAYDSDKYKLTVDTSRYYVIDSNNESVEVIRFVEEEYN